MGRGGPILLLQSGCLGKGGRSGIGTASHFSEYARHWYSLSIARQPRDCTTKQWLPFSGSNLLGVTQEAWVVWTDEDLLFSGLKVGLRLGLEDGISHVIRLKPKAQMDLDITGPYNTLKVYYSDENSKFCFVESEVHVFFFWMKAKFMSGSRKVIN